MCDRMSLEEQLMAKKVGITKKSKSMMPATLVEARMTQLTPNRLDVIHMLLAEIGKKDDDDDNLCYTLTADTYAKLKDYKGENAVDIAYRTLKHKVWGDISKHDYGVSNVSFEVYQSDGTMGKRINFFQSIGYDDGKGSISMKLTEDCKQMLVHVKKTKGQRVFAALQYVLPMQSMYSKRLYMMCKEYVDTGNRYTEIKNFALFRERIGAPASYSDQQIVDRVLNQAQKEINDLSDIEISYELKYQKGRGRNGKKICGVTFRIKGKDNQMPGQMDIYDLPAVKEDMKLLPEDALDERIRIALIAATPQDISTIKKNGRAKKLTDDEIMTIVDYTVSKDVDNAVGYILSIIKNGFSEPKKAVQKNSTDVEPHKYNFTALEKKLLSK